MKTVFQRVVSLITLFAFITSQYTPAAAQAAPALPEITSAAAAPIGGRGISKKATKPRIYNQPAAPEAPQVEINLSAQPEFVSGDEVVSLRWEVQGTPDEALTIQISFPEGYTPVALKAYDPASRILSMPASPARGEFKLNVQNPVENAVFPASLVDAQGKVLAEGALSLPRHEKFAALKNGSSLSARGGKIKVRFPANALSEDAAINIGAPSGDDVPAESLSGQPFEIEALGNQSKQDLHQFAGEIAIEVDYSDLDLTGKSENDLYLYWYDPESNGWAALPSYVDPATKTLHATTTHFSVFDTGINDFQASRLPTMDAFQTSTFTGAATYSLPIEVPAGPGGLQPSLNLSYNSQGIDQSTAQTQASWVGMGWSLGMNSIELDDHGTHAKNTEANWNSDDTWSINVNGVSTMIVKNGAEYRAADENFMKFEYNTAADTWTVWDKSGNSYFFETKVQTLNKQTGGNNSLCSYELVTYQWFLKRMRNIFGKELSYSYSNETKNVNAPRWTGSGCAVDLPVNLVTATYPNTINYPASTEQGQNGRYRVRFDRNENRPDYHHPWAWDAAYHNFQRSRLDAIFVEQDADGDSSFETIIRKYDFIYAANSNTAALIWPGVTWNTSGKTSTLLQVKQYGKGGMTELPTASFTYGDGMHLTEADNGYGGRIEFDYERWSYTPNARLSQTYKTEFTYSPGVCDQGGFTEYNSNAEVECIDGGANQLKIRGIAVHDTLLTGQAQSNTIRPGGVYKFSVNNLQEVGAGTVLKYGLFDGTDESYSADGAVTVALPASASQADVLLKATQSNKTTPNNYVIINALTVRLLPSIYRVTARRIFDGLGYMDSYTYSYSGPAVNDGPCSDAALTAVPPTCLQYREKYSEFRGHASVTETAHNGRQTTTSFYQGDILKGRASSVLVRDAAGKKLSEQLTGYSNAILPMTPLYAVGQGGYGDVSRNWITTVSEENRTYKSDGIAFTATRTDYDYASESNYGNLIEKAESALVNGAWQLYRTSHTSYVPNPSPYLTGLPARQWVTDVGGVKLSETLNIYDANTTWNAAPAAGILSATRAWVDGANYSQVSYIYDPWGNREKVITYDSYATATSNPIGAVIEQTTTFDPTYHTYPLTQTNPLGHSTSFDYGDYALGLPVSQVDANNVTTYVEYDDFGRLLKLIKNGDTSAAPSLQVTYNPNVLDADNITRWAMRIDLRQKIDANTYYTVSHYYDGLGRKHKTETGSSVNGVYALYNTVESEDYYTGSQERESKQSAPYGPGETPAYTITTYNALGRPITVNAPDGLRASYIYDGLTTTVADANTHPTSTTMDVWGRTVLMDPPDGPSVAYTYDPLGRLLTAVRGPSSTVLSYDNAGRKTFMDDPDMGEWHYEYDALGNLKAQIDARGCQLTIGYDLLNRPITKSSNGPCGQQVNTSYTYDTGANGKGRRARMDDASGFTTWSYDERGRVLSENKTIGTQLFTTSFDYNAADLPISMTYPGSDQEVVTNTYTPQMMLKSVTGTDPYVTDTTYDKAGRMNVRSFGNNTQSDYDYHPWNVQGGRLASLVTSRPADQTTLQNISYQYDPVGNIASITDSLNNQTQAFTYDALDRLLSANATGSGDGLYATENYSYDPTSGNLLTKAGMNYTYDPEHPHAVATVLGPPSTVSSFTHDANGNQITRIVGDPSTGSGQAYNLAYDAEGRLVGVEKQAPSGGNAPSSGQAFASYKVKDADAPLKTFTPVKTWNFDANTEGWTAINHISGFAWQSGGYIGGTITGNAPYIHSATNLGVSITNNKIIKIRYKNTTSQTSAAFYFITNTDGTWGNNFKTFPVVANSPGYGEYTIDMSSVPSWTGTLKQLRFDPAGASGSFSVNYIEIGNEPPPPTATPTPTATLTLTPTLSPTPTSTPTPGGTATPTSTATPPPAPFTSTSASFVYDGDGKMVKSIMDGVEILYIGTHYQVKDPAGQAIITKYYPGGAFRVGGVLYFALGDHLGSTSITTDSSGVKIAEMRYKAWGEVRYTSGTTPIDKTYTGQRSYTSDFGLMYYNARWYDSSLGRFAQADTIVPGGVQGLDRYTYTSNNPINRIDPSGHCDIDGHTIEDNSDACKWREKNPLPTLTNGLPCTYSQIYKTCVYTGPIPKDLMDILIEAGADEGLLNSVTLNIYKERPTTGYCADPLTSGYADGTTVHLCTEDQLYEKDHHDAPNPNFMHELVHVRQYLDNPMFFQSNYKFQAFLFCLQHGCDRKETHDNNPYEKEAIACGDFILNQYYTVIPFLFELPPLNTQPCDLVPGD